MNVYAEKLRDPRWQKKRLLVFERAGWLCQACKDKASTLHVHHLIYLDGREPWEYPDSHLESLCEKCHEWREEWNARFGRSLVSTLFCQQFEIFICFPIFDEKCQALVVAGSPVTGAIMAQLQKRLISDPANSAT